MSVIPALWEDHKFKPILGQLIETLSQKTKCKTGLEMWFGAKALEITPSPLVPQNNAFYMKKTAFSCTLSATDFQRKSPGSGWTLQMLPPLVCLQGGQFQGHYHTIADHKISRFLESRPNSREMLSVMAGIPQRSQN